MKTFVIVPVRNQWSITDAFLVSMITQEFDDLLVLDNGSDDGTTRRVRQWQRMIDKRVHLTIQPARTIYDLWNIGFQRARELSHRGRFRVLVTNNDIELPPQALTALSGALEDPDVWASYPDYDAAWGSRNPWPPQHRETHGVFGDGGLFGACFMLAGERIKWRPLVTDPAYSWWYGDNHLAECIELAGGKQVRVVGLPVKHVNEGTAQHHPELYAKKLFDRGQWITRHQRGFGVAP